MKIASKPRSVFGKLWFLIVAAGALLQTFSATTIAQDKLYWDGASGGTWNDANNWVYFPGPPTPIIPNITTVAYFDNQGQGNIIGNLGADQSALRLTFEDLNDPFTIGNLSEDFTLSVGGGGISLIGSGADPNAIINSHLNVSVAQTWINQTVGTLTTAGNVTLGADLYLVDDTGDPEFNPGGTYVIGSAGKALINSGGDRILRVGDTGNDSETEVHTELTIAGDVHLTESTTTSRRLTFNIDSSGHAVINGDILNGADGAAASGLTKSGTGTLTINGDLNYTLIGTSGSATASGTVITGGAGSVTNINGNINNGAQTWTITGGATSGTTATTILNLNSASVTATGTWVVGGTTRLNFTRNGTTTLSMGAWDVRTDARVNTNANTILTGTTGNWTFTTAGGASTTAQINIANANNLTTGTWSIIGSGVGNQVNLGNVTNLTTGAWTLNSPNSQVNWTGSGNATVASITMGATSGASSSSINLSSAATINLGGGITSNISGSQLISGGTVNLNATRTITVNDSSANADLTITSIIGDGVAASGITKAGNGTLVLSGANTFTGATTVSAGRLVLDYTTQNNSKVSNATMTLGNGDLQLLGNASAATAQTIGNIILTGTGANSITLTPGGASALTLNAGTITGGSLTHSIRFVLPTNTTLNTTAADTTFLGAWATMNNGTTDFYAAVSGGKIVAAQSTAADNIAQVWASTLINQNVTDVSGFTGTTDYMNINTLRISGGNSINVIENLNLQGGGILVTSDSTSAGIQGGTLTSSSDTLLITHHGSQAFEVSSDIHRFNDSSGGAVTLNTTGKGTVILSGNNVTGTRSTPNTASGNINILDGTLAVAGGNAISDNTSVNLISPYATFRVDDDETIGNLIVTAGTVNLQSNRLTVRLSTSQNFTGTFVGDANSVLVKSNMVAASSVGVSNNLTITTGNDGFLGSVVVDGGLFHLSGGGGTFNGASSFTLNRGGSMLLDSGTTANSNRISNTASIVLNGANGSANAQQALNRGLWIRNGTASTAVNETVGQLTLRGGSNYILSEVTGGNATTSTTLTVANLTRENSATLSLRGSRLGTDSATVARAAVVISTAGNADETFGNQFRVGGAFANGATAANTQALIGNATNISIVPWVIGEVFAGAMPILPATLQSPGNSFVTYNASWGTSANLGFRPLHLTNEYASYGTAVSDGTQNVRSDLNADTAALSGKSLNSLIINNNRNDSVAITYNITAVGADTLNLTTGAMLFTAVGAVNAEGGATAIATGQGGIVVNAGQITTGSGEYFMFANNISTAGTTINANLTSNAKLTKSGIGLLTLTGNNTNLTDITLNEGTLRINDLDNIGGDTGAIVFAGGTLDLSSAYSATDHLINRNISVLAGNDGRLYITNGKDIRTGTINAAGATFIKAGAGILHLNEGAVINANTVIVEHHQETAVSPGVNPQLVLNNADGINAINANLQIGSGLAGTGTNGTAVVHLRSNEQIVDTSVVSFNAANTLFATLSLFGHTETVAGIIAGDAAVTAVGGAMIQNVQDTNNTPDGLSGRLVLAGSDDYYYGGRIRDYAAGTVASQGTLGISKTGSGTQTLAGAFITYTGTTIVDSGLLRLRDTTAFASAITNNATVELERTNTTAWTYNQIISGTGNVRKTGTGTGATTLGAANTYSGYTDIDTGTLTLSATGSVNNSSAINIKSGATLDVAAKGASGYSYGHIVSGGGSVTGNLNLTAGGSLRPGASTAPSVAATTGNQLGSLAINGNLSLTGGSITGSGIGGDTLMQINAATLNDVGIAAAYAGGQASLTSYLGSNAGAWNAVLSTDVNGVPKHDYVDVSGDFTWNTGSTISYTSTSGYIPSVGDVLNLWDWTNLLGTYNLGANANFQRGGGLLGDLELPDISGIIYDLSLFQSHGIAVVVMVPEPSRALLLLIGFTTPFFLRRRRKLA